MRPLSRTISTILGASVCCAALIAPGLSAQTKAVTGFTAGYTDIGPALGLGGIGSAGASFGGRFEHAIKSLPEYGNGTLGVEASFDYYSWSGVGYSWKYIPIGVTANYHFKLDDPKIDPFVGAGLGYQIISCDYAGSVADYCSNSAVYFIGRVGARYFVKPGMAVYADAGAGAATFNVGLMFKIK